MFRSGSKVSKVYYRKLLFDVNKGRGRGFVKVGFFVFGEVYGVVVDEI